MKIGDLVLVNLTNITHMKIGVIIATTTTWRARRAFSVAWATGTTSVVDASRVIPYEGYAGKNDKDIK